MTRDPSHREEQVEALRRKLLSQAPCFDDPNAYAAGIEDAIDALIRLDEPDHADREELVPAGGWFG